MSNTIYLRLGLAIALLLPVTGKAETAATQNIPLSLKEAVEQALENNLNLKLQQEDTEIAAGSVEIARGRFDELFTAEVGAESNESTPLTTGLAGQQDSSRLRAALSKRFTTGTEVELGWSNTRYESDAEGFTLNPAYSSIVSLDLTQPLMRGLGEEVQTSSLRAAEKDLSSATFQVDSLAADLAAQVKTGYWNLVFAWQDIEVKELSVTLAQKLLEETEAKIEAGKLAEVELYQPQSEVARREEDLIAAERAIGTAEDELKLLVNSKDWLTSYAPVDLPRTAPIDIVPANVLANAIASRPDLKAADLNIDAARLRQKLAEDDLRPALDLIGSVGYGGTDDRYGDALDAAIDDSDTNWLLALQLSMPLDNSLAKGSLQQARAIHRKARTSKDLLNLEVTKSVRTTVRDVHLAIKAMEATRKTSLATRKRLEAEQAKFDAGRSTTLDVLIAQEAYSQALSQEKLTNIRYAQALAELDRIQGIVTFADSR